MTVVKALPDSFTKNAVMISITALTLVPMGILRHGFRPFFLGAALWAPLALALWLGMLAGVVNPPLAFDALAWHQHELLFGYVGGVLAGFLLTAIPNWTGRPPVSGLPLLGLVLLWAAARSLNLLGGVTGTWLPAAADVGFCAVLVALALREIIAGRSWRNLPVVVLLACWGVGCALSQAGTLGAGTGEVGRRLGFGAVFVLIGLIGGRVVPSFTRNWLSQRGTSILPAAMGHLDHAAMAALVVAILSWIAAPASGLTGGLLVVAGFGLLARLARWCGASTLAQPLVLILHLGYGWLRAGLALLGAAILWPAAVGMPVAMHALTAGAIGTMTLAIMTRATLGHTGRDLSADGTTVWIYGLVQAGALLRVLAPALPRHYALALDLAAFLWAAAFVLFALHYGPMLVRAHRA
ncbi:MAG: NnrS family protein [Geminicoccaceae bacterium]